MRPKGLEEQLLNTDNITLTPSAEDPYALEHKKGANPSYPNANTE